VYGSDFKLYSVVNGKPVEVTLRLMLRFYTPLDTKQVISEMLFPANLAYY